MDNDVGADMYGLLITLIGSYICETFFFGIYSAVFLISSIFMLSKRPSTPVRNYMLAVSAVMYAVSAIHWATNMSIAAKSLRAGVPLISAFEMLVIVYLPTINYILSDGIVLWRAWVVWGPHRRLTVFAPPLLSLVCTLILSVAGAVFVYLSDDYESKREGSVSRYLGWTVWGFSVGTNLWATSLICIRTWQHRIALRSLFGKETAISTAEKLLIFMVESGVLYLCIWVVYMTLSFIQWLGSLVLIIDSAIVQVVGIYPMTIVVLVTMRLSTAELLPLYDPETFEPPISIRFSSQSSSSPPVIGNVASFLESGSVSDVAPHEGGSTGTLACDCSEK